MTGGRKSSCGCLGKGPWRVRGVRRGERKRKEEYLILSPNLLTHSFAESSVNREQFCGVGAAGGDNKAAVRYKQMG